MQKCTARNTGAREREQVTDHCEHAGQRRLPPMRPQHPASAPLAPTAMSLRKGNGRRTNSAPSVVSAALLPAADVAWPEGEASKPPATVSSQGQKAAKRRKRAQDTQRRQRRAPMPCVFSLSSLLSLSLSFCPSPSCGRALCSHSVPSQRRQPGTQRRGRGGQGGQAETTGEHRGRRRGAVLSVVCACSRCVLFQAGPVSPQSPASPASHSSRAQGPAYWDPSVGVCWFLN
jgi:hypothetical protein